MKMNIPFVDLAAQQERILPAVEENIKAVLAHGRYVMGPEVVEIEKKLCEFTGAKHTISCASGTDALIMALLALDVGPGDAVITAPFTFIATAEAVRLVGATPVFVDIDPVTFNLSIPALEKKLQEMEKDNKGLNVKAVMPVDLFGLPMDYDEIDRLAKEYDLKVIEDAAQALGGEYNGKVAGSFGDIGCTSFFPAKPLGCYGDGGAVFTDSDKLAELLDSIRIHGKSDNKYDNVRIGINGRFDTLQAAILLPKLEIFPDELEKRQEVAERYNRLLEGTNLTLPTTPAGYKSAWAQYSVLAEDEAAREEMTAKLQEAGVPFAIYYPIPLHLQTVFADLGHKKGDFPVVENCSERIFSLPMHPYLSEEHQEKIAKVLDG